jgi:hypothetical protein
MARTNTTRLAISKPTPGTGEPIIVGTDLGTNWDKVDAAVGCHICTEATKPGSPWDGQLIRTTDTRRVYVWNATQAVWDHIWSALGGEIVATPSNTDIFKARVTGDTQNRISIQAGGAFFWGSGAATQDVNLYRSGNELRTDNAFRCVSVLVTGTGRKQTAWLTTNQDRTNNTGLINVTGLSFAVVANTSYAFRLTLFITGSINGDLKLGFTFPSGGEITWMGYGIDSTSTAQAGNIMSAGFVESSTTDQTLVFNTHGNGCIAVAEGHLTVAATPGTLQARFAQNASNATPTSLRKGSRLVWEQLG